MCSLCTSDVHDLLRITAGERDTWRAHYHQQRADTARAATATVHRAMSDLRDTFNEFRARYRDADSHALIDELHQRTNETLVLLLPVPGGE